MKKKMLFGVTLLASAITLSMSSCDKSKTQEPQTPQTEKATPARWYEDCLCRSG